MTPRDPDAPPRLGALLAAGPRAVARYTGTLLAVFVAQGLLAGAILLAFAALLAQAFSHLPIFDEAVDGDLVALVAVLRAGRATFLAMGGVGLAALLAWQVASWFLVGGLYGVLAAAPEGRGPTARCFGGSGAATYLAYARLFLVGLPGRALVVVALGLGLEAAAPRLQAAMVPADLVAPALIGLGPAAGLLLVLWTIDDLARVELTLRRDESPGAVRAWLRAAAFVARRPVALAHNAAGWLAWLAVTAAYVGLAHGRPMYGAGGAVTLLVIRQGVALLRAAVRVGVLAGQVELGRHRVEQEVADLLAPGPATRREPSR